MTPYLVAAPQFLPVALVAMKAHLNVVHADDDDKIEALQAGVVAMLDGWGGILGRCIMPQEWAFEATGPGPHLLPFPDATDITAQADGEPLAITMTRGGRGLCVMIVGAETGQTVTISATYGLPDPRIASAESLVKLMVQRDFDMLSGPDYDAMTRSIQAHINALRWRRL